MRKGFSMIEMVFVVVIIGVLAGVAVPKFAATRVDKKVATLRSDTANTLKTIVAKVFADNLNTKASLAPHPDDRTKTPTILWGEWIIEVAGLNRTRWLMAAPQNDPNGRGVSPAYKVGKINIPCGIRPYISITDAGDLSFNPAALEVGVQGNGSGFGDYMVCLKLQASYKNSGGDGNRMIPLTSTQTIKF